MREAITHLIAGVPVSDLDASIDWYTRFFGRAPDIRVGDEVLWDVDEHATLFIEREDPRSGRQRDRVRRAARRRGRVALLGVLMWRRA